VIDAKRILKARNLVKRALDIGRGTAHLLDAKHRLTVMSTEMSCPAAAARSKSSIRGFLLQLTARRVRRMRRVRRDLERAKQTGNEDNGDSVLENELAAERESSGSTKAKRKECPACHGSRLNPIARHVRLQGHTIDHFTALSAGEAAALASKLRFRGNQKTIAADLVPEIQQRLEFMENVGLGYLALGRSAKTLKRRRIATHPPRRAARLESPWRSLRPR
jgi:excinuclease ABC subunit A